MSDAWANAPSPCIDVCKYKRQGRCIGCSMTKDDKRAFVALRSEAAKQDFIGTLARRLAGQGGYPFWASAYRRKCEMRGVPCPLDELETAD